MFFINFLKSLFIPKYMARFRSMSVFIAIAIFFISSFVLAIPQMTNISNHRQELVDEQNAYYLRVFNGLTDEDLNILRETSFKVGDLGLLYGEDINKGEVYIYDFEITNGKKDDFVRIVFDTFDVLNPEAQANQNVLSDFEALPEREKGENILLVFYGDSVVYFGPGSPKELKYTDASLNFNEISSGQELGYYLMDLYVPEINRQLSFNTFIACVIFPLFIILILWLFFRSSGNTFTFKELYNMGSIAMILPVVIFFIIMWFLPKYDLVSYFSSVYGIYFLIMMLIINSKRKIA